MNNEKTFPVIPEKIDGVLKYGKNIDQNDQPNHFTQGPYLKNLNYGSTMVGSTWNYSVSEIWAGA